MMVEKIYWDSDCFLGHLCAEAGKVEKCKDVLERAERGEVIIVTSALTLAEVLWMRGGPRVQKDKAELVQKFFRRSYIRVYNVTRKLSESAQILVWDNSIKPKDAIHVATAIHLVADALETFDKKLISKSGTVGKPLLLIREPIAAAQGKFDLTAPEKP
ncbi:MULTISPECIES: type II toxin-antitoxin system VapC family toxin [unclassified Iodidimonas]|jgi:predicted nucleic acid-binding protein|uniref:type II toxin-antitoxin system VapC family toxin n=1 Tax=unclassified Iodidimonas TaxID=2626145 RepID=UPI0024824098|nr:MULTISPECIES: type II toxin-antitoxin system VapC family toxin [unclassified Iodidimonas]